MLEFLIKANIELGVLIVIVIGLRRPFAKIFGSHANYTLWLLPALGFFLPRLTFTSRIEFVPAEMSVPLPEISDIPIFEPSPVNFGEFTHDISISFLLLGWVIVSATWIIMHVIFYRRVYFLEVLKSNLVGMDWQNRIDQVGTNLGMKHFPNVRMSNNHEKALSFGFLKPVIILPKSIDERFSETEREQILMHELMHIKRRDAWAGLAVLLFQALNWPNPLVHIGAHFFRIDLESGCDASVAKAFSSENDVYTSYQQTLVKSAILGKL